MTNSFKVIKFLEWGLTAAKTEETRLQVATESSRRKTIYLRLYPT